MKRFRRLWLLLAVVLISAILVYCQTPPRAASPNPPPPEASMPVQTPSQVAAADNSYLDPSQLMAKNPAEVDNSNLPITPVDKLNITGEAPPVDINEYRLTVDGLVNKPLSLTYEDILAYPAITEAVLLICPFTFADNAEWTGVPVQTILAEADLKPDASQVTFYAMDGYSIWLSLKDVQQEGVFLAYNVDGQVLPPQHGYPLRLVAKGHYGASWVKWVNRIEVT